MKKQSVLLVHNFYQLPGGEDTVVANEKKLLEENGHEVLLYTRHNAELKTQKWWQKLLLPFSTIFNVRTYREIRRLIKENQVDIVHVHNTLNLISPAVYYAAVSCKVPVMQTMHNFRMLCPGAVFYRDGHICEDCVEKGLTCALQHRCYRGSFLQTLACVISTKFQTWTGIYSKVNFICLTEFNREKLLKLNKSGKRLVIDPAKVFLKPNFAFDSASVEETPGNHYLFVGRLEKIKGIDLLLEAFSGLPEVQLHVAGSGKEQYEHLLKEREISNIKLLGQISKEQLKQEYSSAKALVLTSQIYEGFPMAIIEAYANGLPVIAGNIGNGGGLVEDGVTGLHFQYDSAESLKQTILRFEEESINWHENAYKKYRQELSAPASYKMLWEIYQAAEEKHWIGRCYTGTSDDNGEIT